MTKTQARAIVEEIINDLTDRRGLRQAWDNIDEDTQVDIRDGWVKLIMDHGPL